MHTTGEPGCAVSRGGLCSLALPVPGQWLVLLLAVGLLARCLVGWALSRHPLMNRFSDMQYYAELGERLHRGEELSGYDRRFPCPGLPRLLAGVRLLGLEPRAGVLGLQMLADLATGVVLGAIGALLVSPAVGRSVAAVAMVYPPFVAQSSFLLTETLFMFLVVAGYAWWVRAWASRRAVLLSGLVAGAAWALAAQFKTNVWMLVLLVALASLFHRRLRTGWKFAAGMLAGLVLVGWAVQEPRRPGPSSSWNESLSSLAVEFLHGRTYSQYLVAVDRSQGRWIHSTPPALFYRAKNPPRIVNHDILDGRFFLRTALDFVREHPWTLVTYSVEHVGDLFGWVPYWPLAELGWPTTDRWLRALVLLGVVLPGLGGWMILRDRARAELLALPVLSIVIVAFVFYGSPRYRLPYDGFLLIAAAAWFHWLCNRARCEGVPSTPGIPT
jgi:hypothetical protein